MTGRCERILEFHRHGVLVSERGKDAEHVELYVKNVEDRPKEFYGIFNQYI